MNYGYFDDKQREYVITNPRTPTKWINYIGTLAFGGFVDHTGGALICAQDPALNRITRYITQFPASAFNGETLYLRTAPLSPPRGAGGDEGGVSSRPSSSPRSISTIATSATWAWATRASCPSSTACAREVTIFVPLGEPADSHREIRDIKITNISRKPIEVDAIPVVEYTHPDALKQLTNADWVPQTMQSKAIERSRLHDPDSIPVHVQR